jgi:hypothetical protein
MEAGDRAGGAATTAPAWLVLKMWINRFWIFAITWIVDK